MCLLEAAMGAVEDGVAITDLDGIVCWTSAAFDRFVGRLPLDSVGFALPDLLPEHHLLGRSMPMGSPRFWEGIQTGMVSWELPLLSPPRVVDVSWSQVNLPGKLSLVFVIRDRNAIAQSQANLLNSPNEIWWHSLSKSDMAEQVKLRILGLEHDRDQAVAATDAKTRFLASMSHEIRTPLNAVIGMAELLSMSALSSDQNEMVEIIRCSSEHLLRLINDILDISKIETGQLELNPRPFDLLALIADCHNLFRYQEIRGLVGLELTASADLPRWLYGDDLKLRQILINLLGNAFRCTTHGVIRLAVEVASRTGNELELLIRVTDTGIGIAADRLSLIFEEFASHGSASGQAKQSTGLGLPICSRLCQMMGGSISLETRLGEGSCFTVQLPFLDSDQHRPLPDHGEAGHGLNGVGILVVDDNRVNQRVLELMLVRLDIQPVLVSDGDAAIACVEAGGIDLVFMDLEMPRLDGMEATRRLRAAGFDSLYVIALTAFSFHSFMQDWEAVGMNDFMAKPLRHEDLLAALNRFRLWRRRRALGATR
jgi:signal transduction histidine kinase/CheY-like chemotaxis protein